MSGLSKENIATTPAPEIEVAGSDISPVLGDGIVRESGAVNDWDPTKRNQHLRKACASLAGLKTVLSERVGRGGAHDKIIARQKGKTARHLVKACGECPLSNTCELVCDNGEAETWSTAQHNDTPIRGEPGRSLLRRIKADPQAPCSPPSS